MGLGKTLIMIGAIMANHRNDLKRLLDGKDRWLEHLRQNGYQAPDIPEGENIFEDIKWSYAITEEDWIKFDLPIFRPSIIQTPVNCISDVRVRVRGMLRPDYKRASGEVDVPTAIGTEEVHIIAQKDKVGGATFFFEMSKPHPALPTPKCPIFYTEYAMATNPIFTRVMRHAHDIVLIGGRRLCIYTDTPWIQQ
ncbi:unnamed protein product [Clonostachys rhizophaga]|uniref:SNF2 N-terminal domain-containing protein n=1 Tax=Clonostachys rhizophaga TaxID=160324 RepID=A0A9N9VTX2_9HYPO|nr:unnamed protein product [Clonostachys rhizophaga]